MGFDGSATLPLIIIVIINGNSEKILERWRIPSQIFGLIWLELGFGQL